MARPNKKEDEIYLKLWINLGGLKDIPTGNLVYGAKREAITNGGLGMTTGLASSGNNYKSAAVMEWTYTAMSRVCETHDTGGYLYDTETNFQKDRAKEISLKHPNLDEDVFDTEIPQIALTDKSKMYGDMWFEEKTNEIAEAHKKEKMVEYTAFISPRTKKPIKGYVPTFMLIDSWSGFESKKTQLMEEKGLIDDGKNNTIYMLRGKFKNGILAMTTTFSNRHNMYLINTAQLGDKGPEMDKYNPKRKQLQHFSENDKLKDVGSKYMYYTFILWNAHMSKLLYNQGDKLPEYPLANEGKTDLNIITYTIGRCKNSPSGITINQIYSQLEGLKPELSELHYLKVDQKYYGMVQKGANFRIKFYPDENLTRKSVRKKLDENFRLKRAVTLTSEICQWNEYRYRWLEILGLNFDIDTVYNKLMEMGYDWNLLLESRSWWAIDQYKTTLPFLSGFDLLRMTKGMYVPYWLEKKGDKYIMKKEYSKLKEKWDGR